MDHLLHMSNLLDGCITFYDDTTTQLYSTGYVEIIKGGGCWSYVGRIPSWDVQQVSIGNGCLYRKTVQHEFMHALGELFHFKKTQI